MKHDYLPIAFSVISAMAVAPDLRAQEPQPTPEQPQRPNVILLIADDLGFGDLECYGAKNVETPNVNRLASEGIQFTNCHATAATSTPSRYSLLTGEYAWRKSGTDVAQGNAATIIKPEQFTMADLFHNAGYYTGAIGKWHLGLGPVTGQQDWNGKLTCTPRDLGFDYHYIQAATADRVPCVYLEQDTVANYDPTAPIEVSYSQNFAGEATGVSNRSELKLDWSHGHNQSIVDGISRIGYMKGGGKALWKDENIADSIVAHSVKFIKEHKEEPFFLYLCTNDVHVPRWPHERFRGKNPMGLRGDAIVQFDWTVGQVMDALEEAGIADNTLIILSSDNGPILDDGYQDQAAELLNGHSPSGPYRSYKYSGYEGGTMVPFIVRWPERVKPAEEPNATLLSHIDLLGSFGELIGAEIPEGGAIDSGDMLAQFLGESMEHRPWVSELNHSRVVSVRTNEWKYLPANNGSQKTTWGADVENGNKPYDQLFNMLTDPGETTNLAEQNPEILEMMKEVRNASLGISLTKPQMSTESEEHWYTIGTPLRENLTLSAAANGTITGVSSTEGVFARAQWKFVEQADETVQIINRATGMYIDPTTGNNTEALKATATAPVKGWVIDYAETNDCMVFYTSDKTSQMNQGASSRNYLLLNWGGGRHNDDGCQFRCTEVTGDPIQEITLTHKANEAVASTEEDPRWFTIRTPQRGNRYLSISPADGLVGVLSTNYLPTLAWRFEAREDNTFNIINQATSEYIVPEQISETNKQLTISSEAPAAGWEIKKANGTGNYAIVSGDVQINQTDNANQFRIFNWGGGTNTTDAGCKFRFTDLTTLLNPSEDKIGEIASSGSQAVKYYDMWGRPVAKPGHGVFVTSEGKKVIL